MSEKKIANWYKKVKKKRGNDRRTKDSVRSVCPLCPSARAVRARAWLIVGLSSNWARAQRKDFARAKISLIFHKKNALIFEKLAGAEGGYNAEGVTKPIAMMMSGWMRVLHKRCYIPTHIDTPYSPLCNCQQPLGAIRWLENALTHSSSSSNTHSSWAWAGQFSDYLWATPEMASGVDNNSWSVLRSEWPTNAAKNGQQ